VTDEVSLYRRWAEIALLKNESGTSRSPSSRFELAEHVAGVAREEKVPKVTPAAASQRRCPQPIVHIRCKPLSPHPPSPNGTRIASVEMPYMRSVSIGSAGWDRRRMRPPCRAHLTFLEHLLFKGTKRRSAKPSRGVEGWAATSMPSPPRITPATTQAAAAHLPDLCDVLADMYLESVFAPGGDRARSAGHPRGNHDVSRSPARSNAQSCSPRRPCGRSIARAPLTGTVETISQFKRTDLMDFRSRHYTGATTIVTVAARSITSASSSCSRRCFRNCPVGGRRASFAPRHEAAQLSLYTQETEQTHVAMGFMLLARRRPPLRAQAALRRYPSVAKHVVALSALFKLANLLSHD